MQRARSTRIYAAHFTEQELKDALAFYKTPLGKKLIDRRAQGAARKRMNGAPSDWVDEDSRTRSIAKIRAEMKKQGPQPI